MTLTNAQYDAIMREYNDAQLRHRREQDSRREEVYAALPRMAELDAEAAELSMQRAREVLDTGSGLFSGKVSADTQSASAGNGSADARGKAAEAAFRRAMDEIREERTALLQAHGWPADYLDLQADCPLCHDTGFIGNEKCSCFRRRELALLHAQSRLQDVFAEDTFARFDLNYYSAVPGADGSSPRTDALHALETAQEFVRSFGVNNTDHPDSAENLCFYGNVGVGKTFLTHCIAGELLERGFSVLYQPSYELFESLGSYTFSSGREEKALHDTVFSCDLLIIDDLGTELTNAFVASQLFLIMNERALQRKSTVLSTNIPPEAFADTFSERVSSRLLGSYKLVRLTGTDIRMLKKLSGGK